MRKFIALFLCVGLVYAAIGDRLSITNDNGTVTYFNIDSDGAITSVGTQNITGAFTIAGDVAITGDTTFDGVSNLSMSTVIQLDTSTALTVTDKYMLVIGSNAATGAFAMTSDATAFMSTTTATAGDTITIIGTSDTGTVTLTDGTGCIELDGSTATFGKYDNLKFAYYDGVWIAQGVLVDID